MAYSWSPGSILKAGTPMITGRIVFQNGLSKKRENFFAAKQWRTRTPIGWCGGLSWTAASEPEHPSFFREQELPVCLDGSCRDRAPARSSTERIEPKREAGG